MDVLPLVGTTIEVRPAVSFQNTGDVSLTFTGYDYDEQEKTMESIVTRFTGKVWKDYRWQDEEAAK